MAKSSESAKKRTYKEMSKDLDKALRWFEDGDPDIDEALKKYEDAKKIIAEMEEYLKTAQNKINKIKKSA